MFSCDAKYGKTFCQLQVSAIEFVAFAVLEFVAFAIELGPFAIEVVSFIVEFITLALEFVTFTQEFVTAALAAINQLLITRSIIFYQINAA